MDIQYLLSLLTDMKVLLIILVIGLLVALAIYTWRQTKELHLLKSQQEIIKEQVKHKLILNDHSGERPEMASNMSEESTVKEGDDEEWDDDDEEEDESEDHSSYIREIINMQDKKRDANDDYYITKESKSADYDSDGENIVFDNYEEDEDSEAEIVNEDKPLNSKEKAETQLIQRIEQDMKRLENSSLIEPIAQITKLKPLISSSLKINPINAEKPKPFVEETDKAKILSKPKILIIEKPKMDVLKDVPEKKQRGRPKTSKKI